MSTPIIRFKRSSVPGKKPSVSQLPLGELALNTSDGQIFIAREVAGLGTDIVSVGSGVTFFRNNVEFAGISTFSSIFAGDINLTGFITATAFVGDGSQLTGLQPVGAAGTWNIGSVGIGTVKSVGIGTDDANASYKLYVVGDVGVTGIVSATSYEGSGSNLTGIVTSIIAGDNINVSGSTGQVTITGLANTANVVADSLQVSGITTLGVVSATSYEGDGSQLSGIVTSLVAGENISLSSSGGRVTIAGLAKTDNIVADSLVVSGISTLSSVTADNLTVSGNVSIAGTLTYEDVKNVDSIGIITARSGSIIKTGAATTALVVEGDARVTGILTIGTSSLTLDGDTNTVQVGSGLTLGHTVGIQFGDQALHSGGFDVKQINCHSGIITASSFRGDIGKAVGVTTGGRGALKTFHTGSTLEDVLDSLNELAQNVIDNRAVSKISFVSDSTAGGSPLTVTLTITTSGNPDRYDIYWGDGTSTLNTSDSTPSHTYTQPTGGSFTIEVTAKNRNGVGAGSSTNTSRTDYIVVYTPDPGVTFVFYRNSSGGSSLSGNDLYVVEGNSLHLDNNTTNTSGATVDYTVNWGDGSTNDNVASDTADGGADTSAGRLEHRWQSGTSSGTGRDTVTLTLNNHNTATPGTTPVSATLSLKVYDDAPSAPNGLSSKTLSNVSSTGSSPKLAADFTDNTGGTSLSAGDSVNRVTGGTATAGPITTFAYNAGSGTLTANVNGSADGNRVFTSNDDSGTFSSLVIDSESDYQLLNASGSSTSFASSIYYPGLYKGFKARVAKSVASLSTGVNSMQLSHSTTGNTNTVEFVRDNVTVTPTVNVGSATITQNAAGTFRYISGIPYYNSGSPSLTLAGVTVDNLTGQTYYTIEPIEVISGDNLEGTSGGAVQNLGFTFANIDGATTMLSGGIPKVNIGTSSSYAIGSVTVPTRTNNTRVISKVKVRSRNVNGTGSWSSDIDTKVQVHTAAQSGISEIAIAVADALGNSDYTDDGVRVFDLSSATTNTPSYTSSTNFYTNSVYGESSDPGVSGTKEATIRLGVLKYDVTDYSSGYLPAGPNRSGDTGTQYFTFAFRRRAVASFNINITSNGIAGLWIAAPGTAIDNSSTLNGWLRSDQVYAGSGVPGGDTGNNGNGSDGCASNTGARIIASTALSGNYNVTLGTENMSNATGNVILIRIALTSGQSVTSLSIN